MVGVPEHHHRRATGRRTSDLDRVLDRFRPGREERGPLRVVARGKPVEGGGDLDESLVLGDQEARVGEALSLLLDAADDRRVGRTDARHRDPEARSMMWLPSTSTRMPPPARSTKTGIVTPRPLETSATRRTCSFCDRDLGCWWRGCDAVRAATCDSSVWWVVATLRRITAQVLVRSARKQAALVHSDQRAIRRIGSFTSGARPLRVHASGATAGRRRLDRRCRHRAPRGLARGDNATCCGARLGHARPVPTAHGGAGMRPPPR